MKYLQRLLVLLTVSWLVFSCQKEYSVENNPGGTSASAQWSFTEGTAQFKGPVDTVAIDTIGGYTFLTLNGHSSDNKDQITLQVFGARLAAGTYKTPFSLFAYVRNGITMYQTNQTAIDSFTIVITKLDSTGVTGTFSGKAYDSAKNYKSIVNGHFASVFKTSTPVTPVTTDSGNVVLWSKAGCGGGTSPISVSVGTHNGQITKFVSSAPTSCDSTGGFSIKLPVGTYPLVARCGTDSVTGSVTIVKNGCTSVQVDFSTPVTATDYFPTTPYSNWSYAYEGGAPGDTLYTLSTGLMGTITGQPNQYSLFTNTDGVTRDSSFYRKANNYYYAYSPAQQDTSNGGTNIPAFEYRFLNDHVAPGTVITDGPVAGKLFGYNGNLSLKTTIVDTGATATISGKPYNTIIKVKTIYTFNASGVSMDFYATEQWFAKGIGLVKYIDYSVSPFDTPDDVLDITRYTVY